MAKTQQFDLSGFTKQPDGTYKKTKTVEQPRENKIAGRKPHNEIQKEIFNHNTKVVNNEAQVLTFEWQGKHVSLNAWYSNKHWTNNHNITNEWHSFFKKFLTTPYPKFNKYKIELTYNSRLDVSNTIAMPKLLEDTLQKEGIIENDSKAFCRGISLIPDETMKKFSYKITVINGN